MMLFALEQAGRGGERGPGFLIPLLLLLLLGWIATRVIRRRRGGHSWHTHGSPMQTLQERFARGEIDREEFEHRKAVLNGDDVVPPAPQRVAAPTVPTSETNVSDERDDLDDGAGDEQG